MPSLSVFDAIGPNMIGPSSSHTAGAARIGFIAQKLIPGTVIKVSFILYGSFARTYKGHGTDKALLGGLLGYSTDDTRIRDSFKIAQMRGMDVSFVPNEEETDVYPNTVDIIMENKEGQQMTVRGESVGGGKVRIVRINSVDVDFTGEYSTVIVTQKDSPGMAAFITQCFSEKKLNIASLRMYRDQKGETGYTIIETDDRVPHEMEELLHEHENIYDVMIIQA